jgi:uncharacterized phiE125 gp8 family phage protein
MQQHLIRQGLAYAGAVTYPLTAQELRDELRIPHPDQDALLTRKIQAATRLTEERTLRAFVTTSYTWTLDAFPDGDLVTPRSPLIAVASIAYVDENGDSQTLASSAYTAQTDTLPGRIRLSYNQDWPSTREQPRAVTVTFTAGEGAAAADVDEMHRTAIAMLAAELYQQPEATAAGPQAYSQAYESIVGMMTIPRL